ncbi:S24 family peptidase [Planomonospora parontospora]|uniref:S24 family peptidase n=1 Tax=Planomonospora parontospora TaxID=58119 RepID=UPI00227D92B3|nr:S24 family peptidase [Planomonospora parontospora]
MVLERPYSPSQARTGRGFALMRVRVEGESMLPALRPGDWLWVRCGAPVRSGDLVLARLPADPSRLIVKRAAWRDGEGWWLESDNQRASGRRDSWDFGPVPVVGRVVARYRPPLSWPTFFRAR